ncbi:hypothetical protein [Paludisphaera soli]|uniref:hypothetical protein n=1 Tax=Paludisphaera soli TaxID=2712865 RepID=UPI0013EBEF5F|nr:hypothetical protein [Paludisphaera soli]
MGIDEEPRAIRWPSEFIIEYHDGSRERLLPGDGVGVGIDSPADDPAGASYFVADLPKKHPRNRQFGRGVRLEELRAFYTLDGELLWRKG